jgi:hypothetical protein
MNERIRQLAEQATTYIELVPGHSGEGWIFDKEKFAQLIVEECARACLAATEPGSSVHLVSVAYADAVRGHFGVE